MRSRRPEAEPEKGVDQDRIYSCCNACRLSALIMMIRVQYARVSPQSCPSVCRPSLARVMQVGTMMIMMMMMLLVLIMITVMDHN